MEIVVNINADTNLSDENKIKTKAKSGDTNVTANGKNNVINVKPFKKFSFITETFIIRAKLALNTCVLNVYIPKAKQMKPEKDSGKYTSGGIFMPYAILSSANRYV